MDTRWIVAIVVASVLVAALLGWLAFRVLRGGARLAARATRHIATQRDLDVPVLDGRLLPSLLLDPVQSIVSWVDVVRPQLLPALAPDGTITLVFSDVEGSTELNVRLGDARYVELIRAHDRVARRLVRGHRGRVVKSQGDGLMLAFKRPVDAVRFAVAFQRALRDELDGELRVRVGVHTGEALSDNGDFFGANVAFAARVSGSAKGGQVLLSPAVVDRLDEDRLEVRLGRGRRHQLRGIPGRHRLTPVRWDDAA